MAAHTGYDPILVVLSIAIAVFASYTALDLGGRVRSARPGPRWMWLSGAAVAMGGGIWAMHFIGMLAFRMTMPVTYEPGLTFFSLVLAIGATGLAVAWVSRKSARLRDVAVSGPLMGAGIAAMHYTGMAAMHIPGRLAYSSVIVIVSVAISVSAATAALWLTFRDNSVWQKLSAAVVMGLAVAGMHYTGMTAATFTLETQSEASHEHVAQVGLVQQNLALYVAGATFLILFLTMLALSFDQQRSQAELKASEERFRAAVLAVHGVLWTNDAEGRMRPPQPGWAALTGQTESEYEGFGWASAVHPDDAGPSVAEWSRCVAERKPFKFEHRVRHRDGAWRSFSINALPIMDRDRIREWVGVHTDITNQRIAEAELKQSNAELQRYAYIVSHDLRAPLVSVMGFAGEIDSVRSEVREALAGSCRAEAIDRDLEEAVGFIRASVAKMEGLISAILKLSRDGRRAFEPEPLDMTSLMHGLVDAIHHQAEMTGARIDIAADLPVLIMDRLAIEQVFGNLLDNAIKYLSPLRAGIITVTGERSGGRMVYRVADNGRGINKADQSRVFELFRRVGAQDRPGDGIGLAEVHATLRALGGRIELSSQLDEGSTFTVSLPETSVANQSEQASAAA